MEESLKTIASQSLYKKVNEQTNPLRNRRRGFNILEFRILNSPDAGLPSIIMVAYHTGKYKSIFFEIYFVSLEWRRGEEMKLFWIFWSGRTFSSYGDALFRISMPWLALQVGGVWMVAVVVTVATSMKPIGSYIMAPWVAGTGSRRVLIVTDFSRALVNLVFGILAMVGGIQESMLIGAVLILVAVNAFLMGWFAVGMQMYIPTMTENLRTANADLATGKNVVELLGYLTGGLLTAWQLSSGFLFNAGTFLIAGMIMFFIGGGHPVKKLSSQKSLKSVFQDVLSQWQVARKAISSSVTLNQIFWLSVILAACFAPIGTMLAPLAEKVVGGSPMLFGILESSLAAGGILADLGIRKSKWTDSRALLVGAGICAIAEIISGTFAEPVMMIVAIATFGAGQNLFGVAENTVIQSADPELRASVFAVMLVLVTFIYPLASFATAQLARLTSIGVPFIAGGLIAVVATPIVWYRKGFTMQN